MEKPRIQDDLYTYVNQEKLDSLVIPDDKPCVGGFQTLAEDVEKIMLKEFDDMCTSKEYPNEYLKRACTLYSVAKNAEKKNADGSYSVIEGNTSVSSNDNGGCVMRRTRKTNVIRGFCRPKYDTTPITSKPTEIKISKPVVATPTLRKGSKNKQVKYLQQDLNYLLGSNLVADGIFGTKTVSAVKSFQKKYGLGVDGIYGQKSYTKMKDLLT